MTFSPRFACTVALALATSLSSAGCRGDDPAGSATDTDAATTGALTDSASSTGVPTTSGTTAVDDPTTGGLPTTAGGDTCEQGFLGSCTSSGGEPAPGPNGSPCATDDECESMNCFTNPLAMQGICSECNEDQDCVDLGTGISCSIGQMGWAVCEDGSVGDQCMSQAACQEGLFCDALIEIPIPGIFPDFCGECETSADCADGEVCTPELDVATFTGAKKCVAMGSVANDALCPVGEPDADSACMSGFCSVATIMQLIQVGLCGECLSDADCMGGTCVDAMIDPMGGAFSGSKCM